MIKPGADNFTENSNKGDKSLVFTIAEGKSDDSTEDVLKEIRVFDAQYGKPKG